ncbi:FtsX-like permease family protein [Kineococcus sp. SYSU DK003]|uniref:FtsX-like permease family protein n=1 Tax=Kineococcus sp. SYSU DK003 TaxID=3383124 RepID=UPI003D7CAB1C
MVFVVVGTTGLALRQRERELSLLRVLGATPRQVHRAVLAETALLAAVAAGPGVALGLPLGRRAFAAAAGQRGSAVTVPVPLGGRSGAGGLRRGRARRAAGLLGGSPWPGAGAAGAGTASSGRTGTPTPADPRGGRGRRPGRRCRAQRGHAQDPARPGGGGHGRPGGDGVGGGVRSARSRRRPPAGRGVQCAAARCGCAGRARRR